MPRWSFEKFPDCDETLTTQMKSVGEAMAIGRTFKEAFQKCIRSMEIKRYGYGLDGIDKWAKANLPELGRDEAVVEGDDRPWRNDGDRSAWPTRKKSTRSSWPIAEAVLIDKLTRPCQGRPYYIRYAMKMGWSDERIHDLTRIDPWFLSQMRELVEFEDHLHAAGRLRPFSRDRTRCCSQSARLLQAAAGTSDRADAGRQDAAHGAEPVTYRLVDTCAAEFEAVTPYYYSSRDQGVLRIDDMKHAHRR